MGASGCRQGFHRPARRRAGERASERVITNPPLATISRLREGAASDALVADIKQNGLREPLVMYEGMLLDGRNRWRAALAAGIAITDKDIKQFDPKKDGDPEWKFETWSQLGLVNTSPDNHYPTSALAEIKARDVASISADDCGLFLWCTVPMTPQALEVMAAWGFPDVTHFAWGENHPGTRHWDPNQP